MNNKINEKNEMSGLEAEIKKSTYFEKIIEHRFIADLMMIGWYNYQAVIDVLRSETNSTGYDLVISYNNIKRYVQLKSSIAKGKTSYQMINLSLLKKDNPCIVWIVRDYNEIKSDFTFRYLFWGALRVDASEDIEDCAVAKDSKSREKINHRNVPKGKFAECKDIDELFVKLFNIKKVKGR